MFGIAVEASEYRAMKLVSWQPVFEERIESGAKIMLNHQGNVIRSSSRELFLGMPLIQYSNEYYR